MLPASRPLTDPGETLGKDLLVPLGASQVETAEWLNTPFQGLDAIVKGRRSVGADTALLLEALTRWNAEIWLSLQATCDLWSALIQRARRPKIESLPKAA